MHNVSLKLINKRHWRGKKNTQELPQTKGDCEVCGYHSALNKWVVSVNSDYDVGCHEQRNRGREDIGEASVKFFFQQ